MIWFTSDTHYHHKNICRGTSQWTVEGEANPFTRDYETLDAMDDAIVLNINSVVKQEDTLYHLGDWSLGGIAQVLDFRKRINCKNIHLILGNHDENIRLNKRIKPSDIYDDYFTQGNFTSVQDLLEISIAKQEIVLCHYPMRVWHNCHKGVIMLHGHSHGNLNPLDHKSMDVGIDTHPEFRPYSLDEILKIMGSKPTNLTESHRGN